MLLHEVGERCPLSALAVLQLGLVTELCARELLLKVTGS